MRPNNLFKFSGNGMPPDALGFVHSTLSSWCWINWKLLPTFCHASIALIFLTSLLGLKIMVKWTALTFIRYRNVPMLGYNSDISYIDSCTLWQGSCMIIWIFFHNTSVSQSLTNPHNLFTSGMDYAAAVPPLPVLSATSLSLSLIRRTTGTSSIALCLHMHLTERPEKTTKQHKLNYIAITYFDLWMTCDYWAHDPVNNTV